MLYPFLIGKGSGPSPMDFAHQVRYMRDSANALSIEAPPHIAEAVFPHLVGYMWEYVPGSTFTRYALFDEEFAALLCELWYPRSNFNECPTFANSIEEYASAPFVSQCELPHLSAVPF